jgi:glycosyl hydrolase family 30
LILETTMPRLTALAVLAATAYSEAPLASSASASASASPAAAVTVEQGAVRLGATSGACGLEVSAFRNRDGSRVAEILNTGTTDQPATAAPRPTSRTRRTR